MRRRLATMPRRRARLLAVAIVALLAPVPALALPGGGPGPTVPGPELAPAGDPGAEAPADFDVHTSLGDCAAVAGMSACKLDVSYDGVAGATRYSVVVTGPNGEALADGEAGDGGASLWVPYVGDGRYAVRVEAFGPDPEGPAIAGGEAEDVEPDPQGGRGAGTAEGREGGGDGSSEGARAERKPDDPTGRPAPEGCPEEPEDPELEDEPEDELEDEPEEPSPEEADEEAPPGECAGP